VHCLVRAHILIHVDTAITQGSLASGRRLTLVLKDLLKYIVQNGFGVVRIRDLLAYPQDVTALLYIILYVVIRALVR
jgi:hypothetical protein